jgi:mono/diheme cytochrome c family protein
MRRFLFVLIPALMAVLVVFAFLFFAQGGMQPFRVPHGAPTPLENDAALVARGSYLASIGNCAACHTRRGGPAYGGGRPFQNAYGTLYSPNITADREHGIGDWSLEEFVHTMRFGVSRHGVQYPAFPYAQFAMMSDADLKSLYAFLRTVAPSQDDAPANELEFPASSRTALIGWRMLYERPAAHRDALTDVGAYLVESIGHCGACHSERNSKGVFVAGGHLAGGTMPVGGWDAPALDGHSLSRFSDQELADYLRSGSTLHGAAYGPMAETIYAGLHAVTTDDAQKMAHYLKQRPAMRAVVKSEVAKDVAREAANGADLYRHNCSACHGDDGEGKADEYPALRESAAVTSDDPTNLLRLMLYGAVAPTTPGNPRPYSMPPFVYQLKRDEIAALANHVREHFGQRHSALTASEIRSHEGIVVQ